MSSGKSAGSYPAHLARQFSEPGDAGPDHGDDFALLILAASVVLASIP